MEAMMQDSISGSKRRQYQFGQSVLTLEFGDITTSDAQVLVSSDDGYLTMGGGVSAAILEAGGNAIALDAAKKVPRALGNVVVTTAGSLPAFFIFHAVTIDPRNPVQQKYANVVDQATRKCLQLLDALDVSSIAFPAIGAGVARFGYENVAVQMAEVIADNLLKRDRPIQVTIYLFDRWLEKPFDFISFFEQFAFRVPPIAARQIVTASAGSDSDPVRDRIFISYSHKDRNWFERLQTMLKPLVRNNSISVWDDTQICPGSKWREEIANALASAKAAVLFVSQEFLASDFILNHELPPLLKAAEEHGLTILWIYVNYCLFDETEIKDYQAAYDTAKPLAGLSQSQQDEALLRVCQKIKAATTAN
jgi:O-acetyl-ADP-ribose deacetylase (regulator of RNase III)